MGNQAYTPDRIKEQITVLGLKYRIMTQYTSFVAVDKQVRDKYGKWVTMEQAVDLPEGVSPASQFGYRYDDAGLRARLSKQGVLGIPSCQIMSAGGFSSGIDAVTKRHEWPERRRRKNHPLFGRRSRHWLWRIRVSSRQNDDGPAIIELS